MKYIKLFENKILDDILDKISEKGKDSLTKLELDYLKSMESDEDGRTIDPHATKKVLSQMDRERDIKNFSKYDPRKDDKLKKSGFDFNDWSDDDINDGRLHILWDEFNDEEMNNFIKSYNLDNNIKDLTWDKLPENIQEFFQVYLYENDLLKTKEMEEIDFASAWELLTDDEMDKFLSIHQLPYSLINSPWEKLPNEVKNIFIKYAKKINLI